MQDGNTHDREDIVTRSIQRSVCWIMIIGLGAMAAGRESKPSSLPPLTRDMALAFSKLALKCVEKEFPNKPGHVMNDVTEVKRPRALHPAFYGCFDWHSAVHGHWMLVRILRRFPDITGAEAIRKTLGRNLTRANLALEVAYLKQPGKESFERTYGWAWLLKLVEELHDWEDEDGRTWRRNLEPLEKEIVNRYRAFLPKQTYPIRTGVHPNTAFGLAFALDYALTTGDHEFAGILQDRSKEYFLNDTGCPAGWEPGGEDFFSPCLMEADLMRRVLPAKDFFDWFDRFLPGISMREPAGLLRPAVVTDRSDGKLVHLDGLNLSRAWCMSHVARALPEDTPARKVLLQAAADHAADALAHITSGDYAGEHWLASFATYLLTD